MQQAPVIAVSSSSRVPLDVTGLQAAAAIVARAVDRERRRHRWWRWSLAIMAAGGFVIVRETPPSLEALWTLGIVFAVNMMFHVVMGVLTRWQLEVDARREVLDVDALLVAVDRTVKSTRADDEVQRIDDERGLRAR
ncbi:MAG TPA: hypothetical protein VGF99_22290 [Myxococcota bacterium]